MTDKPENRHLIVPGNPPQPQIASRFVEIELQEALVTLRTQYGLLAQVSVAIVAANIAYAGFAFQSNKALAVSLGAFFPIMILVLIHRARSWMLPIFITAVEMERTVLPPATGVATSLILYSQGAQYLNRILASCRVTDLTARQEAIRSIGTPAIGSGITKIVLTVLALCQISTGFFLWYLSHWRWW